MLTTPAPLAVVGMELREIIENAMRGRLVVLAAVVMVAFAAGCGGGGTGQVTDGKAIFTVHCGGCHTLADARTTGAVSYTHLTLPTILRV